MKNDFHADGRTISVPPTVLFSAAAGIEDVRHAVTTDYKAPGDRIYLLGTTYNELGASAFYRLFRTLGASVPRVRPREARALYRRVSQAAVSGWIASCHDVSEGGLPVALTESAIGGRLGCEVALDPVAEGVGVLAALYSESPSRFVASVPPENAAAFEALMGGRATFLGAVTASPRVRMVAGGALLVDAPLERLVRVWKHGLSEVV